MRRMCGTLVQHTRSAMRMRQSPGLASVGLAKRSALTLTLAQRGAAHPKNHAARSNNPEFDQLIRRAHSRKGCGTHALAWTFSARAGNPNSSKGGQYEAGQAGKIDRDHAVPRPYRPGRRR